MDLGIASSSRNIVTCCDCGCKCSLNNASLDSLIHIPELELDLSSNAEVQIGNECERLRETVSSQEQSIQDLYAELDIERNAASTAADESMSMILRLQREKAEIQMDLRQFLRIAEEKMEHDEQNLLSVEDLIYKMEQTIQALTCEAQAYRHRMMSYGLTETDIDEEQTHDSSRSNRVSHSGAAEQKLRDDATDDYVMPPREQLNQPDHGDPDVTKLYARLKALETNRESMRQAIMSMRTEKAQMVLLKEITHHLSKYIAPERRTPLQKAFRFISTLKWITSFVFWRRKAQRSKHMNGMQASNIALQMLLEKNPRIRQWRCLSSTQV